MNRRPTRTFLYLAFVMVFLLIVGLIAVGVLVASNTYEFRDYFTNKSMLETNSALLTDTVATQTWLYIIGETATNLVGFEPSDDYLQTREAERQTEVVNVNATLGPTNAAIYWVTETAYRTSVFETLDSMIVEATILAQTPTP